MKHIQMTEAGLKILDEVINGYLCIEQARSLQRKGSKKRQASLSASEQREKQSLEQQKRALLAVRQRIASVVRAGGVIELDTFYLSYEEIAAVAVALDSFVQGTRETTPISSERDTLLAHVERLHQWFVEALPPLQ